MKALSVFALQLIGQENMTSEDLVVICIDLLFLKILFSF